MDYEIRVEEAAPRQLAVARGGASRAELGRTILKLLDTVWPVLRDQRVRTGHNVVVYFGGLAHIEAGVEVFGDFVDKGDVRHSQTPAGPAVTTAHWGEYSEMAPAYAALERWCATNGRQQTGTSWEVYGDWADDATERRTDIYLLLAQVG
ncbi:MAG: AraC family transcriptional regulator [Chloroflexi bacterium]|nr:MAG: AraC family transcriptional regulator [Chloroflexota bacterium]